MKLSSTATFIACCGPAALSVAAMKEGGCILPPRLEGLHRANTDSKFKFYFCLDTECQHLIGQYSYDLLGIAGTAGFMAVA